MQIHEHLYKECPGITPPEHGKVEYRYGKAIFSCSDKYRKIGRTHLKCGKNGKWTVAEKPYCHFSGMNPSKFLLLYHTILMKQLP